jgi:hypothetical protein
MESDNDISYFATTNRRDPHTRFGIRQRDRLHHMYVIGKTGTGKSTLLETLAGEDIRAGRGLAAIDPHGDLAARLANRVPDSRRSELVYLNAPDQSQPYGYNPLRRVRADKVPLAASGLLEAFEKLWSDAWGVRMEHILRNSLYALLEYGDAALPDILRLLADKTFRTAVIAKVSNTQVREFWLHEFARYNPRYIQEAIGPIQNKVGAFLADPTLRRILTTAPVDLHIREIMDKGKILVVNLGKGQIGDDSAHLLGALLVTTIGLAAFSRADTPLADRRPFFVYVDEFQDFTTLSIANMVSELRKFGVGLIMAHQHLHQLETDVRHAVIGNAGTLVSFRLGSEDAAFFARELEPKFDPHDLMNLANYDIHLKLMIDGEPSRAFSATQLPPAQTI